MAIVLFEYSIYSAFFIVFATLFPVFPLGNAPETVKLYLSTSLTEPFVGLSLLGRLGGFGKPGNNGIFFGAPGTTGFVGAEGGLGGAGGLDWFVSCGNTNPIIIEEKIIVIIFSFIALSLFFVIAGDETRTHTPLRGEDFKSSVSAIPPRRRQENYNKFRID